MVRNDSDVDVIYYLNRTRLLVIGTESSSNRPEGAFVHNATALAQARSIAEYLSLRPISEVHLPLPLNFVFIGFGADGAMNVEIPMKELEVRGIEVEEGAV